LSIAAVSACNDDSAHRILLTQDELRMRNKCRQIANILENVLERSEKFEK
jgi:hypothetical protein